jgi:hypothetical protein
VREKWPGLAHLSKLVSTGLPSTTIFTFFASRSGGLIVIEFLLKPNSVKRCNLPISYLKTVITVISKPRGGHLVGLCSACAEHWWPSNRCFATARHNLAAHNGQRNTTIVKQTFLTVSERQIKSGSRSARLKTIKNRERS